MKIYWQPAVLLMIPVAAFGQLPGLPAPAAPADEGTATVRPGEAPRPAAAPASNGAMHGSLFKQGVDSAAAAQAIANNQPGAAPGSVPQVPISFMEGKPSQPKHFRKNDLVTIVIREDSQSTTDGKGASKKTQDFDLALQQFIQLALSNSGLPTVGTVGSPSSLPEVKFKYDNQRQSDASQERQDSLSARMTATVVDIKPNGTLVIEANKEIIVDKEEQVFKLSGICRVEDIAADNSILSTQLADLSLSKQTRGEVRDGTKSGWLNQFLDKISPF